MSFKDMPYKELIEWFMKETKQTVHFDPAELASIETKVSFLSERTLTVAEALVQVNRLLKDVGYILFRKESGYRLVLAADAHSLIPESRTYFSWEDFERDKLPDDEWARVFFSP